MTTDKEWLDRLSLRDEPRDPDCGCPYSMGYHTCARIGLPMWDPTPSREQLAQQNRPSPIAAAESRGRAAGWREAIEALRGSGDQLLGHQRDGIHPCPCGRVRLGGSHTAHLATVLGDFLESLAPKETP